MEMQSDAIQMVEQVFHLPGAKTNYPDQGQVYLAIPSSVVNRASLPLLVAIHGSNRGALDYRDNAFYRTQRNIALKHGFMFAAVSNGLDTWGLDDGLYNVKLLISYLMNHYTVQERVVLWASSAGGTLANRMVKEFPELVAFVLGTFPVYDLRSGFALDTCKRAWGTDDFTEFQKRIDGKNPADFPSAIKNHQYYISHGSDDAAVPLAENALKMRSDLGDCVYLDIIEGGVHGTSNFAFYGNAVDAAFRNSFISAN